MYLSLYLLASILFCHIIAVNFKKSYFAVFIILIFVFITPSQIETSGYDLAPSVFTFIFNVVLESDYSLRVLRPLALTVPFSILVVFLMSLIKKRLFQ